jgi:hypothetical protein
MTPPKDRKRPAVRPGTTAAGRRLHQQVTERFELDEHELALLLEAVRTVDVLERLAVIVTRDGPMTKDSRGLLVAHPAVVESRQQRLVLARLVASLRLPEDVEGVDARPQRRGAARGAYGITGAV